MTKNQKQKYFCEQNKKWINISAGTACLKGWIKIRISLIGRSLTCVQDDEYVAGLLDTPVVAKVHLVSARLGVAVLGDMAVSVQASEGEQEEVLVVVQVEGDGLRIPRGAGRWYVRHGLDVWIIILD